MNQTDEYAIRKPWRLPDLLACTGIEIEGGGPVSDVNILSLTDDSRTVTPGACFVAVRGSNTDGHAFVADAARRGAAAIVVDRDVAAPPEAACLRVVDARDALARLAAGFHGLRDRSRCPIRLIGITGTNGKTTVAWLLRSILQAAGQRTALLGTIEYDLPAQRRPAALTTPGPVELCGLLASARDAGAAFAVLEVSSHALDQRRCDGLSFAAAVFTNLSGDHLDYHETMERYADAKRRLFRLREADGVAVVNLDDPMGRMLADGLEGKVRTFGIESSGAGVSARVESMDRFGSSFVLTGDRFEFPVRLALVGQHNVANALAAAATAGAVGIAPDAIRMGLECAAGVPGRLQRVEPDGWPSSVFVDYAHTDAALAGALTSLRPLTSGRLLCVFGCGGDRDRVKRPRMAAAVHQFADLAFVTSDNPRTEDPGRIIDDILSGFPDHARSRVEVQLDRRAAIETAITAAKPGDTVLIAGKGHETYQLIDGQSHQFDDVDVARSFMHSTGVTHAAAPTRAGDVPRMVSASHTAGAARPNASARFASVVSPAHGGPTAGSIAPKDVGPASRSLGLRLGVCGRTDSEDAE